ncbi:MAG: hypothetical protein WCQ32_00510 [bacterium]
MQKIQFKKTYFLIISDRLVTRLGRLISLGDNAMAITFWPLLIVRPSTKDNAELIRHETIHIRQQIELLVIGAHLLYLVEYCYARYIKKFDKRQAYYYTAIEQEAHRNAMKEDYLKTRKPYAVLYYIRNKKWLARGPQGELIEKEY